MQSKILFALFVVAASLFPAIPAFSQPACSLTCPADTSVANDAGECGAVVNYTAPTTSGTCGTVTCDAASGSFFSAASGSNVTSVNCSEPGGASCGFTVTVNDTELPTIQCSPDIFLESDVPLEVFWETLGDDNCPTGSIGTCDPESESLFPLGTTNVVCEMLDPSGNSASCDFDVTIAGPTPTPSASPSISPSPSPSASASATPIPTLGPLSPIAIQGTGCSLSAAATSSGAWNWLGLGLGGLALLRLKRKV